MTSDFEMFETHEMINWYLHGCMYQFIYFFYHTGAETSPTATMTGTWDRQMTTSADNSRITHFSPTTSNAVTAVLKMAAMWIFIQNMILCI